MSDELWRKLVNSFEGLDGGIDAPEMERFKPFAAEAYEEPEGDDIFVQKIVTEMYVFTNSKKQVFGEHTFQDMVILGNMTPAKLSRLLARQRRKHEKG